MKKSQGAHRSVLNYIRKSDFLVTPNVSTSTRPKPTGKPGKRRVILSNVRNNSNGMWVGVGVKP